MDYSYIGSGKVSIKESGVTGGHTFVGNASALSMNVNEDERVKKDYTQPGGGTYNEVKRIDSVEIALTFDELSPVNLARACYGHAAETVAGSVAASESIVGYDDQLVLFAHPPTLTSVVVKDETDTTTYVLDTDYALSVGGLTVIAGGAITDGDTLHLTYDYLAYDSIEAMVDSGKEYSLIFEGLNEARSGKPTVVEVFRFKPGAAENIEWIGDDYAVLTMTGKILKDTTKSGTNISQYWKARMTQ